MLDITIKNGSCFIDGNLEQQDIGIKNGKIIKSIDIINKGIIYVRINIKIKLRQIINQCSKKYKKN